MNERMKEWMNEWMNEWISSFGGLTLIKEDWNTWRKISFNSQLSTTISHTDWRRSERGLCCKKLAANRLSHITVSGSQRTRVPKGFKPALSAVQEVSLHRLKIILLIISPSLLGGYRLRSRFQYLRKLFITFIGTRPTETSNFVHQNMFDIKD
jgi:hypothetical protein